VIAAWRLTLASTLLAPIALIRHGSELRSLSWKDHFLAAAAGTCLAIHFVTWITSLEYTTVASSVVFVSTSPLWVAMLAPMVLRESISRHVLLGMFLVLIGGVIIGFNDSCDLEGLVFHCPPLKEFAAKNALLGDVLALLGAFAAAGYILIGRSLRGKISIIPYIFLVYGISAILLILIVFSTAENLFGYESKVYLWFLLLALIPQLIGHSMFNWALRYLSATYVSITMLGEPIGSTILAYILFGEIPTGFIVFGAILILSGIIIATNPSNSK
jgi:drug/metabolite transporter (DMT)-like permease